MTSPSDSPAHPRAASRHDDILHGAAEAVATIEGDAVFRDLVRYLADSLQVDVAFIALPLGADCARMRMLAFYVDGRLVEDFEYPLADSPCEAVIRHGYRMYPSGLAELFSLDDDFRAMRLDSYAGYPLNDARGRTLGLIAVIARKPFASPVHVESILKIFAARAVAEIERRRADDALRLAEASYRAIFESAEDPIFVHDWDTGAIVDVNPKACAVYDYTHDELCRMSLDAIGAGDAPYTAADAARWIEKAKREGAAEFEWHRRNRDGSLHWDEVRLKTAVINGRPHVLAFTREMTARKRAEAELRASEARYRLLFEMESDAILLVDVETLRIVDANRAAVAMYGHTREELLALTAADLSMQPDKTADTIRSPGAAGRVPLRYHRRKDGAVFPVEIANNTLELAGRPTILAAIRDVTERQRAEAARSALEAQLRQAQKMEAIGHLSGGIAHDFNNILTSVMGYVALAAERPAVQGDTKLEHYLDQAQSAVQRARDLIRQMLTFSRGQRGEPRPVALAERVAESSKLLRSTLPSSIELSTQLGQALPRTMIDPVHLEQVLLNLCINARDAMDGVGTIRVTLDWHDALDDVCASCRQRIDGTYLALAVADSGPGIAPDIIDRMFEPFFSTKEVGKGSGMGLATVHGIVHEYGGHVCVQTRPGAGAAFRVLLQPLGESVPGAAGAGEGPSEADGTPGRLQGRVLVVDDDDMVASLLEEMLAGWGLETAVIRNPLEAYDWFMRDPSRVDLVLTDYTMPRMTGIDLAQRLTLARPDLPVLLYSGYGTDIDPEHASRAGVCAVIAKPVEPHRLFEIVREHLPAASQARSA
jgi:PAS domain S-box-containing protein